jgi:hypothetical protein
MRRALEKLPRSRVKKSGEVYIKFGHLTCCSDKLKLYRVGGNAMIQGREGGRETDIRMQGEDTRVRPSTSTTLRVMSPCAACRAC